MNTNNYSQWKNELFYRQLIDSMSSGVIIVETCKETDKHLILDINKTAERLENIEREKAVGDYLENVLACKSYADLIDSLNKGAKKNETKHVTIFSTSREDIIKWRDYYLSFMTTGEIIIICEDATQRKRNELEIKKKNRTLNIVSECNLSLLLAKNESQLFYSICNTIVRTAGYMFAWIGIIEKKSDHQKIKLAASAGNGKEYIEAFISEQKRNFKFNCPVLTTSDYSNRSTVLEMKDCELCGCSPVKYGFNSILSIPITIEEELYAKLNVYSPDINAYTDEEIQLLEDIASSLIYGLTGLQINEKRMKAETELAAEKEELSVTLRSIADGVITVNIAGEILLVNKAAERILLKNAKELERKSINEIFNIKAIENKPYSKAFSENSIVNILQNLNKKIVIEDSQGSVKIIILNCSEIRGQNGELSGYVYIIRDITEIEKIETQLALSQKLESIGRLAAGIAHEINSPMQYIGDNVEFFKKSFNMIVDCFDEVIKAAELEKAISKSIEDIKNKYEIDFYTTEIIKAIEQTESGIDRINKIIVAMKDFTHPGVKEKRYANINKGIESTVAISKNEWKYAADIECLFDPNMPDIFCSIDEINQAILNIIINAAHAIQEKTQKNNAPKGKITIMTKYYDGIAEIIISDTGIGIPEMNKSKIFEPFFTTKDVGKGTGQGLAIVRDIVVNKHGGELLVDSKPMEGSSFTIRIPCKAS